MHLTETFSAMPNTTSLGDLSDAWRWSYAPGSDAVAALSGEDAFEAYALDSFDEGLAVAILSFARDHAADLITVPERPLVLVEGFAHPGYAFDTVVAVSPALHRLYPDEADATYRYRNPAGARGTRWRREPHPFLKLRFRGNNGFLPDEREFGRPKLLVSWITRNEGNTELFVEFENYRHDVYTVEWTDTWTLTAPGAAPRRTTREELLDALRSAVYGPNVAAVPREEWAAW